MNYFRITAYHPVEDISVILDSNGKFEKLWEFSAHLLQKGFKIIEASKEEGFEEGNVPKHSLSPHILLRAIQRGRSFIDENIASKKKKNKLTVGNSYYYTF